MSSTATPVVAVTEELRDLVQRLSAAAQKLPEELRNLAKQLSAAVEKLSEENHFLNLRLSEVGEQLAQRNSELTAVKAKNGHLLKENRDLTLRLALPQPPSEGNASSGGGGIAKRAVAEPAVQSEPATVTAPISAALAQKTLPIGLLFPESDYFHQNMMLGVKDIPAVRDMLEKAGACLGVDMLELCLLGAPADRLERAMFCYIAGLAALEKLRNEREEAVTCAQVMAGLGIGEYAALTAAGVLTLDDGLRLVELLCNALMEAESASRQLSITVVGLDKPRLAQLCATAAERGGRGAVCHISSEFFPLGFRVAGTEETVLALEGLAGEAGAIRLGNSITCAVCTPIMKPAEEKMRAGLEEVLPRMNPPRTTVYMNATAAPVRPGTNPKNIAEVLVKGLTSPLLWGPSMEAMIKERVSEFYEMGGTSLKGIMRRVNARAWRTMTSIEV